MGSVIRLSNGVLIDPFRLSMARLSRSVFTRSLSMLPRYTGHTEYPYTVGQHSLSLAASREVKAAGLCRAALLHDFSEALFNDLASPVKRQLPEYMEAETKAQKTIFEWWGEPWVNMTRLHEFDTRICVNEMRVLFNRPTEHWAEPLQAHVYPETQWRVVYDLFEAACDEQGIEA